MIYFFTHAGHPYTIRNFLDGWGLSVRPRVTLRDYSELRYARKLPPGGCIFADVDRLHPANRAFVGEIGEQIAARGWPMLNRPAKLLYRVELLKALRERGLSQIGAYRVDQIPADIRWPAFVRIDDDHSGKIGALVHDRDALDRSIESFSKTPREKLFVIEYCDTRGPDGIFRKYAVQRIDDRLMPRHVFFSKDWIVKYGTLMEPHLLAEEEKFIRQMPDDIAEQVRAIFDQAGTTYGRLDFGIANGRVQPWEINLNPMLSRSPDTVQLERLQTQGFSVAQLRDAFNAFADKADAVGGQKPLVLNLTAEQRASVGVNGRDRRLQLLGRALARIEQWPVIHGIVKACRDARWLADR